MNKHIKNIPMYLALVPIVPIVGIYWLYSNITGHDPLWVDHIHYDNSMFDVIDGEIVYKKGYPKGKWR